MKKIIIALVFSIALLASSIGVAGASGGPALAPAQNCNSFYRQLRLVVATTRDHTAILDAAENLVDCEDNLNVGDSGFGNSSFGFGNGCGPFNCNTNNFGCQFDPRCFGRFGGFGGQFGCGTFTLSCDTGGLVPFDPSDSGCAASAISGLTPSAQLAYAIDHDCNVLTE